MIDWTAFTPWSAAAGGALVGLAAGMLIMFSGRIAGISGILGGLLQWRADDRAWRAAFLTGILLAPTIYALAIGLPQVAVSASTPWLIVAGLLVGIGTRYGSGCTSGHGICGLARLSPRSLVATLVFVGTGFATVFVTRHLLN